MSLIILVVGVSFILGIMVSTVGGMLNWPWWLSVIIAGIVGFFVPDFLKAMGVV